MDTYARLGQSLLDNPDVIRCKNQNVCEITMCFSIIINDDMTWLRTSSDFLRCPICGNNYFPSSEFFMCLVVVFFFLNEVQTFRRSLFFFDLYSFKLHWVADYYLIIQGQSKHRNKYKYIYILDLYHLLEMIKCSSNELHPMINHRMIYPM